MLTHGASFKLFPNYDCPTMVRREGGTRVLPSMLIIVPIMINKFSTCSSLLNPCLLGARGNTQGETSLIHTSSSFSLSCILGENIACHTTGPFMKTCKEA